MILLDDLRAKQALYSRDGAQCSLVKALLADGTVATALYRAQAGLGGLKLLPLACLVHQMNKLLTGCVIGVRAEFGPGLVLIHPVGIVVNSAVRGGHNAWIASGGCWGQTAAARRCSKTKSSSARASRSWSRMPGGRQCRRLA